MSRQLKYAIICKVGDEALLCQAGHPRVFETFSEQAAVLKVKELNEFYENSPAKPKFYLAKVMWNEKD